jgi:hypothetical protein
MKLILCSLLFLSLSIAQASDERISELKAEILTLAKKFEGKTDQDGKLQGQIEERVQDLERLIPSLSMEERAGKIIGPWRQVFGPYSPTGDGTIPTGSRTDHIYQVIMRDGIFYNVALFERAGIKTVFLLKGNYTITPQAIEGIFVRNSVLMRNIPERNFAELPAKLEAGEISVVHLPRWLPPVGLGGQLLEVYADAEIRILRGLTAQFSRPALYIMEPAPSKF